MYIVAANTHSNTHQTIFAVDTRGPLTMCHSTQPALPAKKNTHEDPLDAIISKSYDTAKERQRAIQKKDGHVDAVLLIPHARGQTRLHTPNDKMTATPETPMLTTGQDRSP